MVKTQYSYDLDTSPTGETSLLQSQVNLVPAQCLSTRLVGTVAISSSVTLKLVADGTFSYTKTTPTNLNDASGLMGSYRLYVNDALFQETVYSTPQNVSPRTYSSLLGDYAGDDEILCLQSTSQADVIYTYTGNDRIKGGTGNDYINGGDGVDTAVYSGNFSNYRISTSHDTITVTDSRTSGDGTDTLLNVERLEFLDKKFAYDMQGNAGLTAKILGSVFGTSALTNKEYVGIGLDLLDEGMSYTQLIDLALNVKLGSNYSVASMISLLHTNTGMTTPNSSTVEFWTERNSAGMSKAWIAEIYADSSENVDHVDLVGLSQTGIEYI